MFMAVNRVRLIYCICNFASTYANTQRLMQMQIHESICNYMKIHVIMQVLCKYMHIVHSITCIKAKSMQLHVNMQIYAWMRISSLAYGGNRGPPTLHQSETCYVHHSLADIDTKNCSRAKSIKSVGRTFFKIRQSCCFWWCLRLFLQKFDRTDLSWCWRIQLAIDTMREFMLFWVALINNWWLHGQWEIQFLREGGHCTRSVALVHAMVGGGLPNFLCFLWDGAKS